MPQSAELGKIRQEIDYNFSAFESILLQPQFKASFGSLQGEKLSRPPKGYDKDNEAIEYLKCKNFIAVKQLKNKELEGSAILDQLLGLFETAHPLVTFLNAALR